MLITVTRTDKTNDGIYGNLIIDVSPFKCVTLENRMLAIPTGTYPLTFMWSDHFQQIMPHVGVPNRSAIEVHWANWPEQLEGCLALGTDADIKGDMITQSKSSWINFVTVIGDQPALMIKYVEDFS
jgi:hypothetical protein